jgi:urease alpha subunit
MRCLKAEALSGAMVEAVHGEGDVLSGDGIETHLLGKELADHAVHVLVGATLSGGVGMGKEDIGIEFACDPFVLGELLAVVGRQRMNAGDKGVSREITASETVWAVLNGTWAIKK